MAKSKATKTVKEVKRWAVRESKKQGGFYWLFVGPKPRKPKEGWHTLCRTTKTAAICDFEFGWFMPERYHLPPGGGPVEITFVKVKAVKP